MGCFIWNSPTARGNMPRLLARDLMAVPRGADGGQTALFQAQTCKLQACSIFALDLQGPPSPDKAGPREGAGGRSVGLG